MKRLGPTLLLLLTSGCMTNLRPDGLPEDRPPAVAEARGRGVLSQMQAAHGGEAWTKAETLSLTMTDEWRGLMGSLANPWPASTVKVDLRLEVGTFNAQAEFLEGEPAGTTWGIQSWRTYVERPGMGITFEEDDDIGFILPALQYIVELPGRISAAELVAYAGEAEAQGRLHDVVFATWGKLDGHSEADQYRLFVDRETRRLTKAHYTVRAFADFAQGVVFYDDYREVNGVLVPHRLRITASPDDAPEDWVHEVTVEVAQVNAVPVDVFVADAALPRVGDEKPSAN